MENMEAVEVFEGPFWNYAAISRELRATRDSYARLCAEAVNDHELEDAVMFAERYAEVDAAVKRVAARFDAQDRSDSNEIRWIGYRSDLR